MPTAVAGGPDQVGYRAVYGLSVAPSPNQTSTPGPGASGSSTPSTGAAPASAGGARSETSRSPRGDHTIETPTAAFRRRSGRPRTGHSLARQAQARHAASAAERHMRDPPGQIAAAAFYGDRHAGFDLPTINPISRRRQQRLLRHARADDAKPERDDRLFSPVGRRPADDDFVVRVAGVPDIVELHTDVPVTDKEIDKEDADYRATVAVRAAYGDLARQRTDKHLQRQARADLRRIVAEMDDDGWLFGPAEPAGV
ncbi:uncharacterized protein V1510DRAFT_409776 [Dipodascopsis tothii]|uniref:uncharacterized protein n=1 Tax=Dipodascopsis tothii TaxID=44089 RepID=UPI0034CE0E6D